MKNIMMKGNTAMRRRLLSGVFAGMSVCGLAGEVRFEDTKITLPTYEAGAPDITPVFFTGRTYQGAQGRVYPYPIQDVIRDEKKDVDYRYLTLKNDWLELGLLPDHGGHLLNLTDRGSGFETFYRQHVVKPALIGILGAWISGGVEWNFPHHHRATTVMPIDWRETDNADGSKTVWLGETELRRRLKWTIGLTLMKDRAVLQAENIFINRGSTLESMLYWANVSVACGDGYEVVFPPSCHLGYDHHKASWTTYPFGPLKPYGEGEIDLRYWSNYGAASRSIFAHDPDNAWLAGYDHKRDAGTAHVSNPHVTVGKKFFLWGNNIRAEMWEKALTDSDGPYLELMVGCWSDNQPDYSWIAPYETRRVKQYWFPVKGIGGIKNVTVDGAVNLERRGEDEFLVGFHSTRVLKDCTVELLQKDKVVFTAKTDVDPNHPWCRTVKVDRGFEDRRYMTRISDAEGRVFLSYRPESGNPRPELPEKVKRPLAPRDYTSAELAYLTGLRLDQFHNALVDPMPYYERALEIDPDYSAAHVAVGQKLMAACRYEEAARHFACAAARTNQNYMRAKDIEPEYDLAVCRFRQHRYKEAKDLFWRCTWRATASREAYAELARIACVYGEWEEALARIDDALERGAKEAKLHVIRAYVLDKLGCTAERDAAYAAALACDPLDYWGVAMKDGFAAADRNRGLGAQQAIEAVCDDIALGAKDAAVAFADAALAKYPHPMLVYLKGSALFRSGDMQAAKAAFAAAAALPGDYCFPSRPEELEALEFAAIVAPTANTWHYLAEVLWHFDRKDEAVIAWRKAIDADGRHALALRCLAFAIAHPGTYFSNTGKPAGLASEESYALYLRALEADPTNYRTLLETDVMAEKIGRSAADRLALLEKFRKTSETYDPCMFRLASLKVDVGDLDGALAILTTRHFHAWEGGADMRGPYVEALLRRGCRKLDAGDLAGARADLELARKFPENIESRLTIEGMIAALERPQPEGIDPYAKFGGDTSDDESHAKRLAKAREIRALLARLENPGGDEGTRYGAVAVFGGSYSVNPESDEVKDEWTKRFGCRVDSYGVGGCGFCPRVIPALKKTYSIPLQVEACIATGKKYDLYVLWCSTNDRSRPVDDQNAAIEAAVRRIRSYQPGARVALLSSMPIPLQAEIYSDLAGHFAGQVETAARLDLSFLDLYTTFDLTAKDLDCYNADRLHMNRRGYARVRDRIADFIGTCLKEGK